MNGNVKNQKHKDKLDQLEKENSSHKHLIKELTSENRRITKENEELQSKYQQEHLEIEGLRAEKMKLKGHIGNIEKLGNECDRLASKNKQQSLEIDALFAMNIELKDKLEAETNRAKTCSVGCAMKTEFLKIARLENESLRAEKMKAEQLSLEIDSLFYINSELIGELAATATDLRDVNKLRAINIELKSKLEAAMDGAESSNREEKNQQLQPKIDEGEEEETVAPNQPFLIVPESSNREEKHQQLQLKMDEEGEEEETVPYGRPFLMPYYGQPFSLQQSALNQTHQQQLLQEQDETAFIAYYAEEDDDWDG